MKTATKSCPPQAYEARASIMKSLAHPSRLLMVAALADGPRCVCELRELVGTDISTVSKHLAVLKNAGIVLDERRGVQIFYHLSAPCVLNFFDCLESLRRANAEPLQQKIPNLRVITTP